MMQSGHQPQYTLYIRRADHAMHLTEQRTGITVAIEKVLVPTRGVDGIFIRMREHERVGVYLMEDEIRLVEELPVTLCTIIQGERSNHAKEKETTRPR